MPLYDQILGYIISPFLMNFKAQNNSYNGFTKNSALKARPIIGPNYTNVHNWG